MKEVKLIFIAIIMIASYSLTAQVSINTDGNDPDASAMLDVKSTEKGMLIPRMTQAEIEVITSPANGLIVFSTTDDKFYSYVLADIEWKEIAYGAGTITPIQSVTNPITGETWMDRNLGASQVATSSTDAAAYGDLYQWGRLTDGHESRTSSTTTTLSSTDDPGHGNFILVQSVPYDWRSPQNDNLWQGVGGTNNPCPSGFRLPTEAEWNAELTSWSSYNAAGAYASPLKLTVGGLRSHSNGSLYYVGYGYYWSSIVDGVNARYLNISTSAASLSYNARANGFSVRCIKD